jgi:hypothetical protein
MRRAGFDQASRRPGQRLIVSEPLENVDDWIPQRAMRHPSLLPSADGKSALRVLCRDSERILCRGSCLAPDGRSGTALMILPAAERPSPAVLDRHAHEYRLKDDLDGSWAARPLELVRDDGRTILVLEDPGGEPFEHRFRYPGSPSLSRGHLPIWRLSRPDGSIVRSIPGATYTHSGLRSTRC